MTEIYLAFDSSIETNEDKLYAILGRGGSC